MSTPLIAILDIGKTHAKLSIIDARDGLELWSARRANTVVTTSTGRELDVVAIERWLLDALREAPHKDRIAAIVPFAHGAAAVLIDRDGDVVAAPDYEDRCFETVSARYEQGRDSYAHTLSPSLPLGLNLGRQLFYLQQTQPAVFARTAHVVLYPQYWAWRLCGELASEVTSLGCHSDLWRPREMSFSSLARTNGWTALLPPLRFAGDKIGTVTAAIAATSGLDRRCAVVCGIHDSNASYLRFLIGRDSDAPFTVVSSGTWTVVMANRADLDRLREDRDMLANVDAFGSPVATARFMGGREYEAIAPGNDERNDVPDGDTLLSVVRQRAMALPAFASGGPYAGCEGRLLNAEHLTGAGRVALATLYSALMTELLVESLAAGGEILVDGPLAQNPLFGPLLAACMPARAVRVQTGPGGGARVAGYLAGFSRPPAEPLPSLEPLAIPDLEHYRALWRERLPCS